MVETSKLCHLLRPGPQHEVIGIAEDDVRPRCLNLVKVKPLDSTDSADRHECRRANIAVKRVNRTEAGVAVSSVEREIEFNGHGAGNSRLESP